MKTFRYADLDGYEVILDGLTLTVVPEGGYPEDAPCVYLSAEAAAGLATALKGESE